MKRLTFDIQIFGSNGFKVISNCRTAANDSILTCKFHTYPDLTIKQLYDISIKMKCDEYIYDSITIFFSRIGIERQIRLSQREQM